MKILLFGKRGQMGKGLCRLLAPLGALTALDRDSAKFPADFERPHELAASLRALRPDVIVNAAAYTAVDRAENEPERAALLNVVAPRVLAQEAAVIGAWLVHYSSDYVFDGSGCHARDESAATAPLNVYGRTKLEGEEHIRASGCKHLILRTSWVHSAHGENFIRTVLRLATERKSLQVVDDQIGAPTDADLLAQITTHAIRAVMCEPSLGGTYHAVAAGETSRFECARLAIDLARQRGLPVRVAPESIEAVATAARTAVAQRPLNSRLATGKLRGAFGLALPTWQAGVERTVAGLVAADEQRAAACEPVH